MKYGVKGRYLSTGDEFWSCETRPDKTYSFMHYETLDINEAYHYAAYLNTRNGRKTVSRVEEYSCS